MKIKPRDVDASGSSNGQILTSDGTDAAWADPSGGGGVANPNLVFIGETEASGGELEIAVSGISGEYEDLIVVIEAGSHTGSSAEVRVRFNDNSGSIYDLARHYGGVGTGSDQFPNTDAFQRVNYLSTFADDFAVNLIRIFNYAADDRYKKVVSQNQQNGSLISDNYTIQHAGKFRDTSPIVKVAAIAVSQGFRAGSKIKVWGVSKGTVAVGGTGGEAVSLPVVNGGAETGDLTGWTIGAGSITVTASTAGEGNYYFRAGPNPDNWAYQDIDVSDYADQIDEGGVSLRLTALLMHLWTDDDRGTIFAEGRDSPGGTQVGGRCIVDHPSGYMHDGLYHYQNQFLGRSSEMPLLPGVRSIRLYQRYARSATGTNVDAAADDIRAWLIFTTGTIVPFAVQAVGARIGNAERTTNLTGQDYSGNAPFAWDTWHKDENVYTDGVNFDRVYFRTPGTYILEYMVRTQNNTGTCSMFPTHRSAAGVGLESWQHGVDDYGSARLIYSGQMIVKTTEANEYMEFRMLASGDTSIDISTNVLNVVRLPEGGDSIPAGGTAGQYMAKASNDDRDVEWIDPPTIPTGTFVPNGGTDGQVLTKASGVDGDVGWENIPEDADELPIGGTTGQLLAKASNTNGDVEWVDAPAGGGVTSAYTPIGDGNLDNPNIVFDTEGRVILAPFEI